jgi:hypothetical protein
VVGNGRSVRSTEPALPCRPAWWCPIATAGDQQVRSIETLSLKLPTQARKKMLQCVRTGSKYTIFFYITFQIHVGRGERWRCRHTSVGAEATAAWRCPILPCSLFPAAMDGLKHVGTHLIFCRSRKMNGGHEWSRGSSGRQVCDPRHSGSLYMSQHSWLAGSQDSKSRLIRAIMLITVFSWKLAQLD